MYEYRNRYGEAGAIPSRTGRYYQVQNEWWFAVRHDRDQGPFVSKTAARLALIDYISRQFEQERSRTD